MKESTRRGPAARLGPACGRCAVTVVATYIACALLMCVSRSSSEATALWSGAMPDRSGTAAAGIFEQDTYPASAARPSANFTAASLAGADTPVFHLGWSSTESDETHSIAWGDYDGDGDLDLAVGNRAYGQPNRLYRNDGGILTPSAVWSSAEADGAFSVAWGDYDGDGDLDLVTGNWGQNRLYRNDGGDLTTNAIWSSVEDDRAVSVAWGDYDGDGDLDLAVGNSGRPNRLYRNDSGALTTSAVWASAVTDTTTSVAWGDYDGDGDLDLAVGNIEQPNRLYRNDGGTLTVSAVWASVEPNYARSVAWGDYDGDGDLDLAVGNYGPNRLYRNDGGALTTSAVWASVEADQTESVAWGDHDSDGDLDLAVGNSGQPNRLYRNDGGGLTASAAWSAAEADKTTSVTWGDYDGDGDLDLAVGTWATNRLYRNDGGALTTSAVWVPGEAERTWSVAWGDYDGDADLDLAVGNYGQPNRLYRNDDGALTTGAVWSSIEADDTISVTWGDYDGDGDLDLAVGNALQPNRLYRNDGGALTESAVWSPVEVDHTNSVAWGDYDGDGDLDLAVGNDCYYTAACRSVRLYHNEGGALAASAVWSSAEEADFTHSVAWGDYDSDGDLDLAVGNSGHGSTGQPNLLYRNDGGALTASAVWSSVEADATTSAVWGDYDGDGDLDLAVGNYGRPNRLYRNDGGALTAGAIWASVEADYTFSVMWGDYDGDGDLDLAVGNAGQPNRLYRNDSGTLTTSAIWSSVEADFAYSVAWGDYDSDGDLDLAVGNGGGHGPQHNRLYANTRNVGAQPGLSGAGAVPSVRLARPTPPGDAAYYSAPNVWPTPGATIAISYTLRHPESRPVQFIRAFYSPDGGGHWLPAVAASGTVTTNLATSSTGVTHVFNWDVFDSGFFGQSDNVAFRIVAVPDLRSGPSSVPGPYLYGSSASDTFTFRVRGAQVRVVKDGVAVHGALVYRRPVGQAAEIMADRTGQPFKTDGQGYLQGRGEIVVGDKLFALAPITTTETFTLYHTNATPTETGLDGYMISQPGVQILTVSSAHPLVVFNLDVALEWDSRPDEQFMSQLQYDLRRTSEVLFDWTNGQAALGRVRIYHDAKRQPENTEGWQPWLDAHVRVYASNRLRPNASQGGIVSQAISETLPSGIITYTPGQVRMGPVWNRYGDSDGNLGEDWPRTLAHELGHFALYQEDNYLGLDGGGKLLPVEGCPSAMSDPYRDDWSEFHEDGAWLAECSRTLSQQLLGRSDWSTIAAHYPWLNTAPANPGPSGLPLALTQIEAVEPSAPGTALDVPIFYLTQDGGRVQPGQSARAFLFQGDWVTDLGRPTLDQVTARGAAVGDRVCVYDLAAERFGCETVSAGDEQVALVSTSDWQPSVTVSPVTTTAFYIAVTNVPTGMSLSARLYPLNAPAGAAIALTTTAGGYTGTINTIEPAFEGYVQVWVNEPEPRREVVVDYALGGGPGYRRSEGGYRRSEGGYRRSEGAPVMSPDGQVILYMNEESGEDYWFYTVQALPQPPPPPPWATVVGPAYRLSASPGAPGWSNASISVSYLGSEVPPGEERWLRLYLWDGASWTALDTELDTYHNMASAAVQRPGVYALMSSIEVSIDGPGWNLISYPMTETRPISEALISVTGYYTTVYGYRSTDTLDPWKIYDVTVPDWVNDLRALEFGRGYWINVSRALILKLKGASGASAAQELDQAKSMPMPPATYYGQVLPGPGFTPMADMSVAARIGDRVCGRGRTLLVDGMVMYSINVSADLPGTAVGCGAASRPVRFEVESRLMAAVATWDNNGVQAVLLSPWDERRVYVPLLLREP